MGTILAAKGREIVKAGKEWLIDSLQIYEEFLCREWWPPDFYLFWKQDQRKYIYTEWVRLKINCFGSEHC